MKLTANRLRKLGACLTEDFKRVFPDGAELTTANLRKARKAGLNLGWLKKRISNKGRCSGPCRICDRYDRIYARFVKTKMFKLIEAMFKRARRRT